ncbi:hypothetical protein Q3G72_024118 [Acer saccharum]|nr:hypothetical protein Q3G72_024118 [Acer saccharum]
MPFFISAAPSPPPSPPPTPPPQPPFDHHETPSLAIFIILLALVANTVIVCFAHQSQEETPPNENQQVANPQATNQQADEAQRKAKKTVIKYVNLVSTIFLFLISMLLQYKFKKPVAGGINQATTADTKSFGESTNRKPKALERSYRD